MDERDHEYMNKDAQKHIEPMFVYEFVYNSDCCESSISTMSIHATHKGAEIAMEFHKSEIQKLWNEARELDVAVGEGYFDDFSWDYDQYWGVRKSELLP